MARASGPGERVGRELKEAITYDDLIEAVLPDEWRWRGRAARANESGGS